MTVNWGIRTRNMASFQWQILKFAGKKDRILRGPSVYTELCVNEVKLYFGILMLTLCRSFHLSEFFIVEHFSPSLS